jgi:histidinol-phosphatase (PHP family)
MEPADNHVHSEWSYDTGPAASMARSCRRALALGLPAVAFTEHLDFTVWADGDQVGGEGVSSRYPSFVRSLDVEGYQAAIARCRERFPGLRVLSGVEAGEPHLFAASLSGVLGSAPFDRVLGSLHALAHDGRLVAVDRLFDVLGVDGLMQRYFAELVRMIEVSDVFEVLAHVDFPRRYVPRRFRRYDEHAYEEGYRTVFRALAGSGRVLEVNTSSPLASTEQLRWWYQEGGSAVSFGSDAHVPTRVGDRFGVAVDVVEAAGFRPGRDRFDFWRR